MIEAIPCFLSWVEGKTRIYEVFSAYDSKDAAEWSITYLEAIEEFEEGDNVCVKTVKTGEVETFKILWSDRLHDWEAIKEKRNENF